MVRGRDAEINQHEDQGRKLFLSLLLNQFERMLVNKWLLNTSLNIKIALDRQDMVF